MRLLRINDTDVDIDEKTALGITLQSYDVKEPGKTFINISNTFSIPLTSHNSQIFGNVQDVQSLSTLAYDSLSCNYWQDNEQLLIDSKVRIESIDERINLFAFNKPSIWDELKDLPWPNFMALFLDWLQTTKSYPSVGSPFVGASSTLISQYATSTEGLHLPFYFGNLYKYDPAGGTSFIEDNTNLFLSYKDTVFSHEGGHFTAYVKTIFEFIEDVYDVNFLTAGGILPGNIWDDPIAQTLQVPVKEIKLRYTGTPASISAYFLGGMVLSDFAPLTDTRDAGAKTLNDFVTAFMQILNTLKDDLLVDGEPVIRLARFDDLEDVAEVVDFSGRLSGTPVFKPTIPGYAQQNRIKFSDIYPQGDELINSRTLTSSNENLDLIADLFSIDSYINSLIEIETDDFVPDLSLKEAFKTFSFFLDDGLTTNNINIKSDDTSGTENTLATIQLQKAALYSLDSEYNFLDEIITYPKFYEIEKWLTLSDIRNFEYFKQYFIRELGGSFFINKISGFNPDKALKPTKIELIKISNKTPVGQFDIDYWTDGVDDPFVDGEDDFWD